MKMKYDKATIDKAKKLYAKGVTLRDICKETGIKSDSTILFHCKEGYREYMRERSYAWRKKNPERWKEMNREVYARRK